MPNLNGLRITFFGVCFIGLAASGQSGEEAFVRWATKRAIPIASLDFNTSSRDLQPVKKVIGKARVVALGEPVHGAHEPLAFRNRMIRYLVTELGFRAVATETGFTESWLVDSYINGGDFPLENAARNVYTWDPKAFGENRELVEWLRRYNADPAHVRKVHFYGIDVIGGQNGRLRNSRLGIDFAIQYLTRADAAAGREFDARWQRLADRFSDEKYKEYSGAERVDLDELRVSLLSAIRSRQAALVAAGSEREYAWAVRGLEVLDESMQIIRTLFALEKDPGRLGPVMSLRDRTMDKNVRWALQQEPPVTRIAVFAHNFHMMNAKWDGGVFLDPPAMAGTLLRASFGRNLVIIGVGASNGKAMSQKESVPGSIDGALQKTRRSPFLIDLRPAASSPLTAVWLKGKKPMGSHGNVRLAPVPSFDALFYIESLTPAKRK